MSVSSRSSSIQSQYSNYPYQQDAIRVVAQHSTDDGQGQNRRFSVDPQLTSFDILRNLVGRAFDMKGDFAISYRAVDDYGGEAYLPMVSDWDLSAAFLSASDPDLQLIVENRNVPLDVEEGADDYNEPWDVISTRTLADEVNQPVEVGTLPESRDETAKPQYPQKIEYNTSGFSSQTNMSMISRVSTAVSYTNQQYALTGFNTKINTTGIFNAMEKLVQKAKNLYDDLSVVTSRPPLSDVEFRNYLDIGGTLCKPRELRFACYHGGIDPSLRKVVWKHLLNVYPDGLTGNQRMDYIRSKSKDYFELRDAWKTAFQNGQVSEEVLCVSNMVRKDALRTDRHLKFYAGQDDNQNVASLFNILTTYALNHPTTGYCQGMSDLASPLLYTMGDEAQAYICFCSLMDRLKPNFSYEGLAMSLKFTHLSEGLAYYDQEFWLYLKALGSDDLLFAYRWLLLELKREFAFDDALKMMEVMWASLPYKPRDVPLYEVKFTHLNAHAIPLPIPSLTSSYSKVCAIRRSSTAINSMDIRQRRYSNKKAKGTNTNLSLDENSLSTLSTSASSTTSVKSHRKPFYSLDESSEVVSSNEFDNASPFEILSPEASQEMPKPKVIKNLREFWTLSKPKSFSSMSDISPDSNSTASSTYESLKNIITGALSDADLNGQVFLDEPTGSNSDDGTTPTEQCGSFTDSVNTLKTDSSPKDKNLSPSQDTPKTMMSNGSHPVSNPSRDNNELLPSNHVTLLQRHIPDDDNSDNGNIPSSSSSINKATNEPQEIKATSTNGTNLNNHHKTDSASKTSNSGNPSTKKCDVKKSSQAEPGESENDSGHCVSASFENSVEPEFQTGATKQPPKMPTPETFGGGNPFLMFLCITLMLQHRDHIMKNQMDYNETAMFFDKMIRKHNVSRVLAHARQMYSNYLKQNVSHA